MSAPDRIYRNAITNVTRKQLPPPPATPSDWDCYVRAEAVRVMAKILITVVDSPDDAQKVGRVLLRLCGD